MVARLAGPSIVRPRDFLNHASKRGDGRLVGLSIENRTRLSRRRGRVDVGLGEAHDLHPAIVQLRDDLNGHDFAAGDPV
jgi:hypothetical protein